MNLTQAVEEKEYIIKDIKIDDDELMAFLFSLGCYSGENISVIFKRRSNIVISVKDSRYSIDTELAKAILI